MTVSVVDRRVGNLPVDLTSFVGRRRELAEVKSLLSSCRLVTLTGMGGVGKTRLAVRVAADLGRGVPDGAWLVELAGLRDPGLIGQEVAGALGYQDRSTGWTVEKLSEQLASRQLLIVLDNCEHLLNACAVFVDALLRACPGVRVLATSRQPLGIAGEHTLTVPPLSVPGPGNLAAPDGLCQYEAVRLFLDRAIAVHPDFTVDAANQSAVAGICRRLDGIPLAIELAAGRLRALSADQLLRRLDDRYGLLTGGSRAALPRQQTLQALIDWSFELCSPAERELWARLSVFSEAFDVEAAEEVCGFGPVAAESVFELLAALVDKSIVMARDVDGSTRYHLPDTLREYGEERLRENGQTDELRCRLRDRWSRIVALVESQWFGPKQVELLALLHREHADVRAALNFCLTVPGESQAGLAIAAGLRFYWATGRRPSEGRHWLDRLLAIDRKPTEVRVKALYVDGYLAILLSDAAGTQRLLDEADRLAEQIGDPSGGAYVAQLRGLAALFQADPARAATPFEQALAAHQKIGDEAGAAYDQIELAMAAALLGDDQRAIELLEECLVITEARGEHWLRGLALWALGVESCRRGDHRRAADLERQSIRLRLPLHDRFTIGLNLKVLAWTAADAGNNERAARLFGAARAIAEALETSPALLGHLSRLNEQYETAARRALGDAAFDHASEQGALMGFDNAVRYALGETERSTHRHLSRRTAAGSSPLTRRESEIAELITRGLSNKEIATTLMISQRTAEGHVEHILAKLGFTTRAQVAAWVAERRATAETA